MQPLDQPLLQTTLLAAGRGSDAPRLTCRRRISPSSDNNTTKLPRNAGGMARNVVHTGTSALRRGSRQGQLRSPQLLLEGHSSTLRHPDVDHRRSARQSKPPRPNQCWGLDPCPKKHRWVKLTMILFPTWGQTKAPLPPVGPRIAGYQIWPR
jgi:hypothetical protein